MNTKTIDAIWDVLVSNCGARESERQDFLHHWPRCIEYRFVGRLGFGGKIWWNNGEVYVSCYREDETAERRELIEQTNDKLKVLSNE